MNNNDTNQTKEKKKGFFGGLFEKLDKRMKEKALNSPCCCKPADKDKNSCCS